MVSWHYQVLEGQSKYINDIAFHPVDADLLVSAGGWLWHTHVWFGCYKSYYLVVTIIIKSINFFLLWSTFWECFTHSLHSIPPHFLIMQMTVRQNSGMFKVDKWFGLSSSPLPESVFGFTLTSHCKWASLWCDPMLTSHSVSSSSQPANGGREEGLCAYF